MILVGTLDLLLEVLDSLGEGLDFLRDSRDGADHVGLLRIRLGLDELRKLVEAALHLTATAVGGVRCEPEDVALVLENLLNFLQPDVVNHDATDLLQRRLLNLFIDARETLAHERDKQVKEDELDDDGREDEHDPDDLRVLLGVCVFAEVAEASEVRMNHCI